MLGNYQLALLIKDSLDEKSREEILESVRKSLGEIKKEDLWGSRNLVYKIKKDDKAFYAYFEFETEPGTIPSLDKSLKLNEDIIRYLLIRK